MSHAADEERSDAPERDEGAVRGEEGDERVLREREQGNDQRGGEEREIVIPPPTEEDEAPVEEPADEDEEPSDEERQQQRVAAYEEAVQVAGAINRAPGGYQTRTSMRRPTLILVKGGHMKGWQGMTVSDAKERLIGRTLERPTPEPPEPEPTPPPPPPLAAVWDPTYDPDPRGRA